MLINILMLQVNDLLGLLDNSTDNLLAPVSVVPSIVNQNDSSGGSLLDLLGETPTPGMF